MNELGITSALRATLQDLRQWIAKAGKRALNEQDTKAALIEPVLRALGWDTGDVDEVAREYRAKRHDKPVDYGLLLRREPRLFIEAKPLRENLSDHKWANQIMGYASVAGVPWIVLTNGEEWRIYNTHAAVRVEEKLFRSVRITDEGTEALSTLSLLARDELDRNRLDRLWDAHFVDRQVRSALEDCLGSGDKALVAAIQARAKKLAPRDVVASLRRARVEIDFPVVPEVAAAGRGGVRPGRGRRAPEREGSSRVSLRALIDAGILRVPADLVARFKGKDLHARIEDGGLVRFGGRTFDSLSTAGAAAKVSVSGPDRGGREPATNGWEFWKVVTGEGEPRLISDLRARVKAPKAQ